MEKCFKCGASSEETILYDAISNGELIKICANCNIRENLPLLKKAVSYPGEKRETVYERMSKISGFNPKEREIRQREEERRKQNEEAKQIMDKDLREELYSSNTKKDISGESNLVRNFHWEILKARRAKRLTQAQLADVIGESELAIRMAERGILPRERERMVKKIETYLHIKITKNPIEGMIQTPQVEVKEAEIVEVPIETKKKFSLKRLFGFGNKPKQEDLEEKEPEENGKDNQ